MTNDRSQEKLGGSWIVDAGPDQMKTVTTYTPVGEGQYAAAEFAINFDWSLGGAKPTATHGSTLTGVVEKTGSEIRFVLISYALDRAEKAVYILKATGNKVFKDPDTINVINLVLHVYDDPEHCNPVTDTASFTIPETGTFPPVLEYRIK